MRPNTVTTGKTSGTLAMCVAWLLALCVLALASCDSDLPSDCFYKEQKIKEQIYLIGIDRDVNIINQHQYRKAKARLELQLEQLNSCM
jgi:hypothetical protein